jgi:hypothetical protein
MGTLVPETCRVNKPTFLSHLVGLYLTEFSYVLYVLGRVLSGVNLPFFV